MATARNVPPPTLLSSSEETRTTVAAGMEKGTKTHVQKYQKLEGLLRNDVKCLIGCANKMNDWLKCKFGFEVMNKEVEWYKRLCSAIEQLEQVSQAKPCSDSVEQVRNPNGAKVSFGELIKPESEVVEEGEGCAGAEIIAGDVESTADCEPTKCAEADMQEFEQNSISMSTSSRRPSTSSSAQLPAVPVQNQTIAAVAVPEQEIERGRVLQCQFCHLQFSCREHLSAHMEAHHTAKKTFNCTICQRSFAFSQSLRTHMGTHVDTTGTGQSSLGRGHGRESTTAQPQPPHPQIKNPNTQFTQEQEPPTAQTQSKRCKCTHCGRTLANNHSLKIHQRIHASEKLFVCPICSKSLSCQNTLTGHLNKHRGLKPFECDICKLKYYTNHTRQQHMRKCHAANMYSCTLCGLPYATLRALNIHIKGSHTGNGNNGSG